MWRGTPFPRLAAVESAMDGWGGQHSCSMLSSCSSNEAHGQKQQITSHSPAASSSLFSLCLLSITSPLNVPTIESSLFVLLTLPPELVLVKAGRCLGLLGLCAAADRYDAGLNDRLAMATGVRAIRLKAD